MKQENINKVAEALMDEFGIGEKLATFAAKSAIEGVGKALIALANKVAEIPQEEKE